MAKRKASKNTPQLPHGESVSLGEHRELSRGDEFHVKGGGRFKFLYVYKPDGSVTAWGPVNSQHAMFRSFRLEDVGTIHRTKRSKS